MESCHEMADRNEVLSVYIVYIRDFCCHNCVLHCTNKPTSSLSYNNRLKYLLTHLVTYIISVGTTERMNRRRRCSRIGGAVVNVYSMTAE